MGYYICAELKGTAIYRSCKGIVYNEGYTVSVSCIGELLYIKNGERRVSNSFTEYRLRIGAECRIQLLLGAIRVNEGELNAHLLHSYCKEIIRSTVNGRA